MTAPLDFRFLDEGLGGPNNKKRKRNDDADDVQEAEASAAADMQVDEEQQQQQGPNKRQAVDGGVDRPVYGKPTYDSVIVGKVSGRKWKALKTTRASALRVSVKGTSLEERNRLKQLTKAYKERKEQLKEAIRLHKVEKRRRMQEAKKRKEENVLKSGLKLQKVTNPKKLKKMTKKQRKNLHVVPG